MTWYLLDAIASWVCLAALAALLAFSAQGAYLRAVASTRLAPTPIVLGLRRRDLVDHHRASAMGLSGRTAAVFAVAIGACAGILAIGTPEISPQDGGLRADASAALAAVWALSLAAIADRRHGVLPPSFAVVAGFAAIVATAAQWATGQYPIRSGAGEILLAGVMATTIEGVVRFNAASSGRRALGSGDPPLLFASFAWAGPVGGTFCLLAAFCSVLFVALVGRGRQADHAPIGVALAAATAPFILFPYDMRVAIERILIWLSP